MIKIVDRIRDHIAWGTLDVNTLVSAKQYGWDINKKDNYSIYEKTTPLEYALKYRLTNVASILLENGGRCEYPYDVIILEDFRCVNEIRECIKLLEKYSINFDTKIIENDMYTEIMEYWEKNAVDLYEKYTENYLVKSSLKY